MGATMLLTRTLLVKPELKLLTLLPRIFRLAKDNLLYLVYHRRDKSELAKYTFREFLSESELAKHMVRMLVACGPESFRPTSHCYFCHNQWVIPPCECCLPEKEGLKDRATIKQLRAEQLRKLVYHELLVDNPKFGLIEPICANILTYLRPDDLSISKLFAFEQLVELEEIFAL